jgi:hypothetical protein
MTAMLEKAFRAASQLPDAEQDALAARLLAELEAENAFDQALEQTAHKLAKLTEEALAEHRVGLTLPFPD